MAQQFNRRRSDRIPSILRDWLVVIILFGMLATMNVVTALAAREAKEQAARVREALEDVNVTAQNRCIIRVILSFPPPVSEGEFDTVLADYDDCIEEETAVVNEREEEGAW